MRPMLHQRQVAIASSFLPRYHGGLAAYQRCLAESLSGIGIPGTFVSAAGSRQDLVASPTKLPWKSHVIARDDRWNGRWRSLLSRMASRPILHGLLERMVLAPLPLVALRKAMGAAQVVHFIGTGWDFSGFAFLRAARSVGARFTIMPAVHPQNWGDDQIDLRLYRQSDAIICQSDHEKRHLCSLGIPEQKMVRGGLPPMCDADGDETRFRVSHDLGGRPSVLFLGRRNEGKGYPSLLRAWKRVVRTVPEAVLVVGGAGGAEFEEFKGTLPAENLRDLGIPDDRTKADALAACDVFCLPSAHESFGIVYVEAWSYGKPVVCGVAPACRELVANEKTGLWSEGTPECIAEKLISLLRLPAWRQQLGEAGRHLQQTQYTDARMRDAHLKAWDWEGEADVANEAAAASGGC